MIFLPRGGKLSSKVSVTSGRPESFFRLSNFLKTTNDQLGFKYGKVLLFFFECKYIAFMPPLPFGLIARRPKKEILGRGRPKARQGTVRRPEGGQL